jgi:hypothetical protein
MFITSDQPAVARPTTVARALARRSHAISQSVLGLSGLRLEAQQSLQRYTAYMVAKVDLRFR